MRAMPSATDSTVPTSGRAASPASIPWIRSRRIFESSSGLISTGLASLCRFRDFLSQSLKLVADARVEHHVPDPQHQAPEDVGVDLGLEVDLAVGLALDLGADALDDLRVQ